MTQLFTHFKFPEQLSSLSQPCKQIPTNPETRGGHVPGLTTPKLNIKP